jgi:PAS domain S-box-containing protein
MDLSGGLAKTLLDLAPDPTVVVDATGTIVFANAQVAHAFGYDPAEIVGRPVELLLPDRFKHAHPAHRARFAEHAKPRPMGAGGALHGRHKLGKEFPVEISLSPVATPDGLLVVAAIRDATLRRDKEDQLIAANRQKTRFLAAASHDLRQPLQTLNLLNRAAKKQAAGNDAMLSLLESQQVALDSMAALLASVLDISKLDSGGVTASPVACAIGDILERIRSDFGPQAAEKELELVVERSSEGVLTDPELMRRLIGNLVSNAIRYTQRGQVRVSAVRNGAHVVVEVADTGVGVPREQLERIFDEFYQVDRGAQRPEGLGLGLSIVRRLQQLLGCGLQVESVVGKGTAFRVTVAHAELAGLASASRAETGSTAGGRVLIVDDERAVADATSLLLSLEGFDVSTASSESEALEHVREGAPDVIVSDFHLRGGETGAQVVAAVRLYVGKAVPVIFITGDTSRSTLASLGLENSQMLNKPVRADDLLDAVRARIASGAGERSQRADAIASP